jgi:hypothetical protein
MTNEDGPGVRECVWTLEIGHWDFIGIWDLGFGHWDFSRRDFEHRNFTHWDMTHHGF